jgi:two-component system, cell cycle response regulator
MAEPGRFDAVITDLNMPRLSGIDLARAVHATDPAKPVILISGFLAGEQFPPVEETGIRELVAKPFSARQLSAALRRVLDAPAEPIAPA